MIVDSPNEQPAGRRLRDYRKRSKSRTSILIGIGISVLIHAIGLWWVIERVPLTVKVTSPNADGELTVSLLTPANRSPARKAKAMPPAPSPATSEARHPPVDKHTPRHREKKAITRPPAALLKPAPKANQAELVPSAPPPADDMFTQLQAARRRRAEAQARDGAPDPETRPSTSEDTRNDSSIALANIARSVRGAEGADRINAGGVFEVRHLEYEDAELVFRGWSPDSRRNSLRIIPVERGSEPDIETAVVKKIIAVIREEKTGDFLWDSHRLGATITLSARVQDSAALQQFLMREFFPDYRPSGPR